MKRSQNNILSLFLILLLTMASCEKPIQNFERKDHDPKIVLNGILNTDSNAVLMVSRSADLLDSWNIDYHIADLSLVLKEGDTEYPLSLEAGFLYSNNEIRIKEGMEYQVEASARGYTSVFSSIIVPTQAQIKGIDLEITKLMDSQCFDCAPEDYLKTNITIDDEKDSEDFYLLEFYMNDCTSEKDGCTLDPLSVKSSSPLIQFTGSGDFSFYAADINSENWGNHFYFSDQSFNGKSASISFYTNTYNLLSPYYYNGFPEEKPSDGEYEVPNLVVRLKKLSKDLYLHMFAHATNNSTGDFPLTEPVYIPSNITNGLGIFGAQASSEMILDLSDIAKELSE